MYRKLLYIILFSVGIAYAQYDTVITVHRDTLNSINKYDTLILPQSKPLSAPWYQFLYSRKDTNDAFDRTFWYDIGRNALWFKKDATKKYNLLIYDSLFNYLNNKSAYGYLGEGTDNYLAKFTTSSQTAVVPIMTSNTYPSGQASSSLGGSVGFQAFNEAMKNYTQVSAQNYTDYVGWTTDTPDSLTAWIMYKFPTQKTITKYQMGAGYWYQSYEKPKQGGGNVTVYKLFAYPTAWKLYGSIDSSTWVRLDSCAGQSFGGAVDTTGLFVNGQVTSYSLNSVTRATFTDKESISGYLYYKLQITAFTSGNGIYFNTNAYYKIYIGSIQMYEGATVNFADSKISQSSGGDTVTANAIFKTTDRIEANGTVQANGMITSLKDGIKLYDTYTPYKYNLFETYGQTDNVIYRFPQSLPSSNQYIKALTIAGTNPSIITLGWGTDATGGGGSTGGNVWKGGDTTVNKLTKWTDGHTITGSNFSDNGAVPMYGPDTLATRAWHRANDTYGSAGSGEANTASNLGGTYGWYSSKSGVDLRFKGLSLGAGLSMTDNGTYYTLTNTASSGYTANKVSTAILPLYKTNDTTITLKGLTTVGNVGQVIKTDGTNLYWGADETASGTGGGDVYKYSTGGTNGYLAKWYNSNTIMNSLFSENASNAFWNGDTLVRRSYWRLHDRRHLLTSLSDHSISDWGGFPGDTLTLKTNGNTIFWGVDQTGGDGGGSGDLTGTGYATTYIRPYSYWTGTKTLGYKGIYQGIRDSSYGIDGEHFTIVPYLMPYGDTYNRSGFSSRFYTATGLYWGLGGSTSAGSTNLLFTPSGKSGFGIDTAMNIFSIASTGFKYGGSYVSSDLSGNITFRNSNTFIMNWDGRMTLGSGAMQPNDAVTLSQLTGAIDTVKNDGLTGNYNIVTDVIDSSGTQYKKISTFTFSKGLLKNVSNTTTVSITNTYANLYSQTSEIHYYLVGNSTYEDRTFVIENVGSGSSNYTVTLSNESTSGKFSIISGGSGTLNAYSGALVTIRGAYATLNTVHTAVLTITGTNNATPPQQIYLYIHYEIPSLELTYKTTPFEFLPRDDANENPRYAYLTNKSSIALTVNMLTGELSRIGTDYTIKVNNQNLSGYGSAYNFKYSFTLTPGQAATIEVTDQRASSWVGWAKTYIPAMVTEADSLGYMIPVSSYGVEGTPITISNQIGYTNLSGNSIYDNKPVINNYNGAPGFGIYIPYYWEPPSNTPGKFYMRFFYVYIP